MTDVDANRKAMIGMTVMEKAIKGLEIERECVSRDCNRNCSDCDLAQDREWLLSVYDDALGLLKEQQEERERIVRWLSKFCIHIDQYPNGIKCSDAERYVFFRNKMHQQFGW